MTWAVRADAFIAQLVADLPPDTDLRARRALLRRNARYFHGGTSWGKRVWAARSRRHLEAQGQPPKSKPAEPTFPADIIFPFRSET